jgi:hypothetical protein
LHISSARQDINWSPSPTNSHNVSRRRDGTMLPQSGPWSSIQLQSAHWRPDSYDSSTVPGPERSNGVRSDTLRPVIHLILTMPTPTMNFNGVTTIGQIHNVAGNQMNYHNESAHNSSTTRNADISNVVGVYLCSTDPFHFVYA